MTERITLRAKSDGTKISGDRVYNLPTTPGCVFKATVRGVENVRVMVALGAGNSALYVSEREVEGRRWHTPEDIDPATVRIELEGDGNV